jgi:phosphatidate cytidylyltransferase
MKNILIRSLTGIVYVTLVVLSIQLNQYTFLALFSVITWLCLNEFYGLMNVHKKVKINRGYHCFGGILLFASIYLYASSLSLYVSGFKASILFLPYFLYIVSVLISELYEKQADPITHVACIFLGQCYIALPLSLLNLLAFRNAGFVSQYHSVFLLALFVFIWTNDTGAYVTGRIWGKHRLFSRISPKKSWEGFAGGLIFTLASSFVFAHFEPSIPYYHWIGISLLVALFAVWGDLVESLIKRTLDVKDSGHALPGHGGFLDRFDSLLLAVYAIVFYVQAFIQN